MTALTTRLDGAIERISTRRIQVPLLRPWGPDVPDVTVIEVVVTDSDGATGRGFSWTPSIGASSVQAMLDDDIRSWALGREADAKTLWEPLWRHLHEAGGGGVTTIAMAGLDTALWDLAARRADRSLADLLGRKRDSVPVYGSGVNLHYPLSELIDQTRRWLAAGFSAVKIKVGSPDLRRDVERVRVVRELVGSRPLMVDANQRWDLAAAVRAMDVLAEFRPAWVEEPLRADDLDGYRKLAAATDLPIACGENLYTRHRFSEFATSGAVTVLQPNVVRVGGITPLLRIAGDLRDSGVRLALHLLPELSGQLALTLDTETPAEVVDGAGFETLGVLAGPDGMRVEDGRLWATGAAGLGIEFR